jgi:RHS repeat-associated protein
MTFTYNAENRQATETNSGGLSATYLYDGDGKRVEKLLNNGQKVVYVYDALGKLAAEYDLQNAETPPPCTTCYLSYDHLGSLRMVTDQNANVVGRHDYIPFGEEIPGGIAGRSGQFGSSDTVSQKFTGKERDSETSLDYFGARYYGAGMGRFLSADPYEIVLRKRQGKTLSEQQSLLNSFIMNPQAWNKYAYALEAPLHNIDLDGHCSAPAGLKSGQTGICVEAFIAAKTIGGIGKGDSRAFTGTDGSKTQRVRIDITVDAGRDGAVGSSVSTARSETTIGLSAQGHTEMVPLSVTTDSAGNRQFEVDFEASNGFAGLPGAPPCCISADLNFSVTPGGQASLDYGTSSVTGFPSFAIYSYQYDNNGQLQVTTLSEMGEKDPSYLAKPQVPVLKP